MTGEIDHKKLITLESDGAWDPCSPSHCLKFKSSDEGKKVGGLILQYGFNWGQYIMSEN